MLDTTRRRILLLLLVSAVLISGVAGYQLQHDSVEVVTNWGPITITKGGTYSGNWQSNSTNPAVTIATTEPVVIENSNVRGYGHLISITAVADVTVRNSYGEGLWTTTAGTNFGRFIWSYGGVKNLTVEHNETVRAAAVKVVNARPKSLKIRYNKARNIYGDDSNCCGGGYMQFVQFGNVVGNGIEVAWNEVVNEAGKRAPRTSSTSSTPAAPAAPTGCGSTTTSSGVATASPPQPPAIRAAASSWVTRPAPTTPGTSWSRTTRWSPRPTTASRSSAAPTRSCATTGSSPPARSQRH